MNTGSSASIYVTWWILVEYFPVMFSKFMGSSFDAPKKFFSAADWRQLRISLSFSLKQ